MVTMSIAGTEILINLLKQRFNVAELRGVGKRYKDALDEVPLAVGLSTQVQELVAALERRSLIDDFL